MPTPALHKGEIDTSNCEISTFVGLGTRAPAFIVDLLFTYFLIFAGALAATFFGVTKPALLSDRGGSRLLFYLVMSSYLWITDAVFEASLGKRLFGLGVRASDGLTKASVGQLFVREFIGRWLSSICFGVGYWRVDGDPKRQAWSDKLTQTTVVKAKKMGRLAACLTVLMVLSVVLFLLYASSS